MPSKDRTADRLSRWRKAFQEASEDALKLRGMFVYTSSQMPATHDEVMDRIAAVWHDNRPNCLLKAFASLGLNPDRPDHHVLLLVALADACFGRGKVGSPRGARKWTLAHLLALARHEQEVKQAYPSVSSGAQIADRIRERYPDLYRHTPSDQIRRRLPKAREERERLPSSFK